MQLLLPNLKKCKCQKIKPNHNIMKNKYRTKKRLYNNKNKTRKIYYGGAEADEQQKKETDAKESRGIYSHIKKKIYEVSEDVAKYVGDKIALSAGYVPKNESEKTDSSASIPESPVVEEKVPDLPENSIKEITDTGKEVAHKVSQGLEVFNEAIDTPELRKEISDTFENVSDVATIGVRALDKPVNEAAEKVGDIVKKVAPDVIEAGVSAGFSALKAVPWVGSALSIGSMVNNISEGAEAVVQAGTEATEVTADLVKDTLTAFKEEKDNFEKEKDLEKQFDDKKKEGEEISNRVNDSIEKFEETNKLSNSSEQSKINNESIQETKKLDGGSMRRTRKIRKRKHKVSKRVRFML